VHELLAGAHSVETAPRTVMPAAQPSRAGPATDDAEKYAPESDRRVTVVL